MILGINVVHDTAPESRFRPYGNPGCQVEPPWRGDWNARVYDQTLLPGELYRMVVSDAGSVSGNYLVRLNCPEEAGINWTLNGSVSPGNPYNVARFGTGNAWIEFTVRFPVALSKIGVDMIPADESAEVTPTSWQVDLGTWSSKFLSAVEPFQAWRAMDFCGCGSKVDTVQPSESFGGFARRQPRPDDVDAFGRWNKETGVSPRFWFPPGRKVYWINCPLYIAADPVKSATWIVEAHRHAPPGADVRVAVDNELENNSFTAARAAFQFARALDPDQAVARTLGVLLLASQLQDTIAALGIAPAWKVVFETMPRNFWPFSTFAGQRVSERARELLAKIGRIAPSPYVGRGLLTAAGLRASIDEEIEAMRRWHDLVGDIAKVDAYELGLHFAPGAAPTLRTDPAVLELVPYYLDKLASVFEDGAVCCWYGLCERDQWGLLQSLDDVGTDPLYLTVTRWIKSHSA